MSGFSLLKTLISAPVTYYVTYFELLCKSHLDDMKLFQIVKNGKVTNCYF